MHMNLDQQSFLGFIVQNNLPPNSCLCDEVDRQIQHLLLEDNKQQITLMMVLFLIKSCWQQLQHDEQDARGLATPTFNLAQAGDVDDLDDPFPYISYPVEAYLEQFPEEQWGQAMTSFFKSS